MKIFLLLLLFSACNKADETNQGNSFQIVKNISYNGVSVDLVINKPENNELDVLMVFHGTVRRDSLILQAAHNALDRFKSILERKDMMVVSVVYPEENLLFGDNIQHCEAALLWLKNMANSELGVTVKKIFLAGHSQGGYLVTRLNTMYQTDGVIANAPGPLNLVFRCQLEENGQIPNEMECTLLYNQYGSTATNPDAYFERSLLNFTDGFKSDILFVQGMNDSPIQMYSWPLFKQKVENCTNCQNTFFLELTGFGHNALFTSTQAKTEFNGFINSRR
ncbi:MAG: alpha/beta hydrolase fold domain-containing protein [Bacteroidales bacterium]